MPTRPDAAAGGAVVVPLFRDAGAETEDEEVAVGLPPASAASGAGVTATAPALAGPPVWLLIGPNYAGKTTFARWAAERMIAAGRGAVLAAADPANRTLAGFFAGVAQPATNDAAQTAAWLRRLVEHAMAERLAAVVDLGGGDTSLGRLLDAVPDLAEAMEAAGVAPVAAYFLGPRVDDLGALASFEARGFRPGATAVVLNHGRVDAGMDPEAAFGAIRRHSAFRAALARGAVVLEMPRLSPPELALDIERKRLPFAMARDGVVPEGRRVAPIGGLNRAAVRAWLERMEAAFAPVAAWLP
ncbi:hypothetical protein [Roseicella aquatilis]|uniref:Uncharacterized protein n=1 Tax=Roseicella aquatilis TaxID=2527868 RepID=A0A4V2WL50_9PROT|nr:hypothetical protein [Roseicella aquatilis]TCZ61144.1 hypothetical protein EXY23_13525 [Roseicella aquatilis]